MESMADALQAAQQWLALTDAADYARGWDTASGLFRAALAKAAWSRLADAVRTPLGARIERSLHAATSTRTLPGVPDGDYLVLQFACRFADKAAAIETLTMLRERDGIWRVAGYFIR